MITYPRLKQHPSVFLNLTGLRPAEFDRLLNPILPRFAEAHRLAGTERQGAPGGGDKPDLAARQQIRLTVTAVSLTITLASGPLPGWSIANCIFG